MKAKTLFCLLSGILLPVTGMCANPVMTVDKAHPVSIVLADATEATSKAEKTAASELKPGENVTTRSRASGKKCPGSGISGASRRPRLCWEVKQMPNGMTGVYQIGIPAQLSATDVGISLNIRCTGVKAIDFEVGNDLLILDDFDHPDLSRIQAIDRANRGINPLTGKEVIFARYPKNIGFVPLGVLAADGKPHPHAGTGFLIGQVTGFPTDRLDRSDSFAGIDEKDIFYGLEVKQCTYDGRNFKLGRSRIFAISELIPGYLIGGGGMSSPIPDGDNLLMGFSGSKNDGSSQIRSCGILRWHRVNGEWKPFAFQHVIGIPDKFNTISGIAGNYVEPSVVRAKDGSLVFTAREVGEQPFGKGPQEASRLKVWRSPDNGLNWSLLFEIPRFHPLTPLSVNRSADGSLYVAANGYCTRNSKGELLNSMVLRETLLIWPLKADYSGLEQPLVVRDGNADFGVPPFRSFWRIDHPMGLTVRLKDGHWRHLLFYRALEHNECDSDAPITPSTGCYAEEIYSRGTKLPIWRFQ